MRELLQPFAEHLGVSPDEAAPALEEALAAFTDELATTGRAVLEGVGTFAADDAGAHFEPDELLLATVNGDYEGLGTLAEPAPIAVPFLTAFPVVPVAPEGDLIGPFAERETEADRFGAGAPDEGADLTSNAAIDEDLAAAMAGTWTAPPSPPVTPLEPTRAHEAGGDTVAFEDADFSFVSPPTPAMPADEDRPSPFSPIATPAPFAATATNLPAPVVAIAHEEERRTWSAAWWAVPAVLLVAMAVWLYARSGGTDASQEPPAGEIAESGASGEATAAAGGGAVGEVEGDRAAAADGLADDAETVDAGPAVPADEAPSAGPSLETPPTTPPTTAGTEAAAGGRAQTETAPDERAAAAPAQPAPAPTSSARPPARERAVARPSARERVRRPARETTRPAEARARPPVEAVPSPAGTLYGLTGTGTVDPAAGGVTWILNSTSASEATGQADRYRSLGFRSAVLSAVVDGRRVHRVAVGQFPGVAEALAARSLLPPDAPADAWILRLGNAP